MQGSEIFTIFFIGLQRGFEGMLRKKIYEFSVSRKKASKFL